MAKEGKSQSDAPLEVALMGHLSRLQLVEALARIEPALVGVRQRRVLVDCRSMTGYERAARDYFAEWHARYRTQIASVAIVTERVMWHLVVSGMALASGVHMKAFSDRGSAVRWLTLT